MGILNIRNIPEKVHRALRERAAKMDEVWKPKLEKS